MGNVLLRFLFGLEQEDGAVFGVDDKQVPVNAVTRELRKKFHVTFLLLRCAGRMSASR